MPVVFYQTEAEGRARVTLIHYMPEQLDESIRAQGIEVTEIPEPMTVEGKIAVPYVNPQTGEFWYEYVDKELTPEERIAQLERALLELTIALGGNA